MSTNLHEVPIKRIRFNWLPILKLDKFFGKIHPHKQEKARRKKQIDSGIITKSNGLKEGN